jgi:hypothetical protein
MRDPATSLQSVRNVGALVMLAEFVLAEGAAVLF